MLDKTLKQPIETLQIFGILSTYMKNRKKTLPTYLCIHIPTIWQILKRFVRTFHQAYKFLKY